MIDKIQPYSMHSSLTFQAAGINNNKIINNKDVSRIVDSFVSKPKEQKSLFTSLKDIFFELFPSLHSTYRRMLGKQAPFRVPVDKEFIVYNGKEYTRKINAAKEFANPDAESIYKQIKKTSNPKEKAYLSSQLGEYRLVDLKQEEIIDRILRNPLL